MRCWFRRTSPRKGRDRKTHGKTKGTRRQEQETEGMKGTQGGRFTSFTPLTALIDQFLMQIKHKEALTYPGKLKRDPNRRSRDKYCHFHVDHGHDTADCYDLKQQIKTLIKQGKLQKFIKKERVDLPPQEQNSRRDNE